MRVILFTILLAAGAHAAQSQSNERFSFVHITDCHITSGGRFLRNLASITSEVRSMTPPPAFVLATGDQTEMGFTEEYEEYNRLVSQLPVPVYNVMGNHEAKWSNWGKAGARQFWHQQPFYSFDFGTVHFVALDSSMWIEHHGFLGESQREWLEKDLKQHGTTQPVVFFSHHAQEFLGDEPQLLKLLAPYNVRLALVGHGHQFVSWIRNDIHFEMTHGAMNGQGGYRIVEVTPEAIRSYRKLVGNPRELEEEIALRRSPAPFRLVAPPEKTTITSSVEILVEPAPAQAPQPLASLEFHMGKTTGSLTRDEHGLYRAQLPAGFVDGWHELSVRLAGGKNTQWNEGVLVHTGEGKREAWRFQSSGAIQGPVCIKDGRLYFGTWGGNVYGLKALTGQQLWSQNVDGDVIGEVAADAKRVYVGTTDGKLVALDAATGARQWDFATSGPIQGSVCVHEDTVLFGSGDCSFYAVSAENGRLRWKFTTTRMVQARPLCIKDTVYFGCWDQHFYALNVRDGSLRWKTPIGQLIYFSPANSNPATDGSRILVAATPWHPGDPDLFCLDSASGAILWKRRNPGEKSHCAFNTPYVAGERFYIASLPGEVFCMNVADGKELWRTSTGQEAYDNSPVFAGGMLFQGGLSGDVSALNAQTGRELWRYSTGENYLFASATAWGSLLFVPSMDGSLTALHVEK